MNEEQLEAEIERLNAHCERMASDLVDIADDHSRLFEENARLKAEVERLTKAGDAMASSIQFNEEMAQDYNGPTIVHQSVQRWNAAKEGKGQP
jgi:predicted nuclease with TOPRIM domain